MTLADTFLFIFYLKTQKERVGTVIISRGRVLLVNMSCVWLSEILRNIGRCCDNNSVRLFSI
jgi:hypothetical protein